MADCGTLRNTKDTVPVNVGATGALETISVRLLQFSKADTPIDIKFFGSVILFSPVHDWKV